MKVKIIFIFFFLLSVNLYSQIQDTLFLNSEILDTSGTILVEKWKYHSGDDSTWASIDFNDSDWDTLNSLIPTDGADFDSWTGIGWFRKYIKIDSLLFNKPVALMMWHYGASEIYLNGKLVKEFGKVANDVPEEKIYQPHNIPVSLLLSNDSLNVIAIRYSNYHASDDKDWYKKWIGRAGFQFRFSKIDKAILQKVHQEGIALSVNIGISAIFLALSFLYIILFFFYSMKKENLYYSIFTFFIFVSFLSQMINRFDHTDLNFFIILGFIRSISMIFIFSAYLAFLYSIFYKKFPKQFWAFLLFSVLIPILLFVFSGSYDNIMTYLLLTFIFLSTIEGLRVIIIAIKKKKENAWIIGVGVIFFALFVITLFIMGLTGNGNINSILGVLLFFLGLVSLPISMSVYLARNIATTNKNLEEQIITVRELSQREIEHQKKTAELEIKAERERLENERKSKELEEARALQLSMLPKELPKLPDYEIAVYMKTATEVGGDYYDFHVSEDNTLTVAIGDATGHGLMAGTMVTATKSLFNSFAGDSDILSTLNKMGESLRGMQFKLLSMCFSIIKIKDKKLEISSAGMPPALIYRAESDSVDELLIKGMPLGTAVSYSYELKETILKKGDTIFLYSDGFPELFNENREMLGYNNVKSELLKVVHNDPDTIIDELNKVIKEWAGDRAPDDDITFVVIKIK